MGFNSSKNDEMNKPLFIGGFTGNSKKTGEPIYCLHFAVKPTKERENAFGYDSASCWVEKDTYQKFMISNVFMTRVDANIMYVRGGYALISYNL